MPGGVWESIIGWLNSFIGSFGFTIILIAIILKTLMLPLDYYQRKATLKNSAQQARIAPQMQKLKEKFGHDRNLLNQKQAELYKRENVNIYEIGRASCRERV